MLTNNGDTFEESIPVPQIINKLYNIYEFEMLTNDNDTLEEREYQQIINTLYNTLCV